MRLLARCGFTWLYLLDENFIISAPNVVAMSKDDKRGIQILEDTYKLDDDSYEVGLL